MNDDRLEQAEAETPEIAREGDDREDDDREDDEPASNASATAAPQASNVVRTTSPYAPDDIREGETFEQRDPATLRARAEGDLLIH